MPDQTDLTIPVAGGTPAEPCPPDGDRYPCVISTCHWYLDVPPTPVVDPMVLADVFGPGVMAVEATNQHHAHIERELRRHLSTHTVQEFVTEIGQLKSLCLGLTAQMAELGQAYRTATAGN